MQTTALTHMTKDEFFTKYGSHVQKDRLAELVKFANTLPVEFDTVLRNLSEKWTTRINSWELETFEHQAGSFNQELVKEFNQKWTNVENRFLSKAETVVKNYCAEIGLDPSHTDAFTTDGQLRPKFTSRFRTLPSESTVHKTLMAGLLLTPIISSGAQAATAKANSMMNSAQQGAGAGLLLPSPTLITCVVVGGLVCWLISSAMKERALKKNREEFAAHLKAVIDTIRARYTQVSIEHPENMLQAYGTQVCRAAAKQMDDFYTRRWKELA